MKAYLKTFLTPQIQIFDTDSKVSGFMVEFLEPQVSVYDDSGRLVYVYGNPEQESYFPWVVLGVFGLVFYYFWQRG